MKVKSLVIVLMLMGVGTVQAANVTVDADSSSAAISGSNSGAQGNSLKGNSFDQRFDSHNKIQASDLSRQVPAAIAPALTTTLTETCHGSMSMGMGVAGFGMSGGATYTDEECVRRLDARQLHMLGRPDIAFAMMCDSELVRKAAATTANACPVLGVPSTVVAPVAVQSVCDNPKLTPGGKKICLNRVALTSGKPVRIL